MNDGERFDAIVVGAGPAGSAAAAVLAERGRRVLLLEKDRFPRPKVCGEFLSARARGSLERLGVRRAVEAAAETIRHGTIFLPGRRPGFLPGRRPGRGAVAFTLPEPALGISRYCLDELLAARARALGAECHFGVRVTGVEGSPGPGFEVRFSGVDGDGRVGARAVVGAWGRWDSLDRELDRGFLARGERSRRRFFGWSRDYAADPALSGEVRLYAFPGGYCGLSRVEGGAVNLAGVVDARTRSAFAPGWESVVAHARARNSDLDRDLSSLAEGPIGFLGTGPVFFTAKPPVERGMLMVGDAAGVIDPFSGEGQSVALASGILAAETLERGLCGEVAFEDVPRLYAAAWDSRFRRRFHWSAAFRRMMLHPALGRLAAPVAGTALVRLALRKLTAAR